jgi:uncharacterized membrane protein YcaP (DUF421 family)
MEILLRASIVFVLLLAVTRTLPRRTITDLAPFELVLLVVLGDIVQQGITQEDYSLTGTLIAVSSIAGWSLLLTNATWRWRRVADVVDGVPLVIVRDGEFVMEALRVERLPTQEVLEAARQQGLANLADVRLGILEPSGRISFLTNDAPRGGGG